MTNNGDKKLTCRECSRQFIFTLGEQEFYEMKGFNVPSLCRECRSLKPNQRPSLTCSQCGNDLEKGTPVQCNTCVNNYRLEFERKMKQKQEAASAAYTRLLAAEQRKAEFEEALRQAEQVIRELEVKGSNLSRDLENLEKAYEFHVASAWLQPALENMEERLKALEHMQCEGNQNLSTAIQTIKEMHNNISLWEIIRRSLIPYRTNGHNTRGA